MTCVNLESLIGSNLPTIVDQYIGDRELEIRIDGSFYLDDFPLDPSLIISMNGHYASERAIALETAMNNALELAEAEYEKIVDEMPMGSTVEMYRLRFFKGFDGKIHVSEADLYS